MRVWCSLLCLLACALPPVFAEVTPAAAATPGLKDVFKDDFLVGVALGNLTSGKYTEQDLAVVSAQFNACTAENGMKPKAIQPREGEFTFAQGDAMVAYAQAHGMTVIGHCLVWHDATPDWFFLDGDKPAGRELALQRLRTHIQTTVGHYRGKVLGWDVVNEALVSDAGRDYRDTKWLQTVGEDYIEKAFEYAHEADPDAQLYYNDYSIEFPVKRQRVLALVTRLQQKGIPVTGVGMQGHWELDKVPFKEIEDTLIAFRQIGVKVMITELDLDVVPRDFSGADVSQTAAAARDPYAAGCPPEVLARQAEQYAQLFRLCRQYRDVVSRVTFWGYADGKTWLNSWPSKRTNYPLLFDRQLQPKPALSAILAVGQERK